jgi:hypothetical protein
VSEEKARNVGPAGIEVAYERIGDPQAQISGGDRMVAVKCGAG